MEPQHSMYWLIVKNFNFNVGALTVTDSGSRGLCLLLLQAQDELYIDTC